MLRKISGTTRDEITEDWMGLHFEEFHDLCCAQNFIRAIKIKKNEMGGICGTYFCRREVYTGVWWG